MENIYEHNLWKIFMDKIDGQHRGQELMDSIDGQH